MGSIMDYAHWITGSVDNMWIACLDTSMDDGTK